MRISAKKSNIREPIVHASKKLVNPVVVEVGVRVGDHAKVMDELLKPKKLHLIDPWEEEPNNFVEVLKKFGNNPRVFIWPLTSEVASEHFLDNSVDLVYIDGDHSYEAVLLDLKLWYPKVKKGGFISGHDWDKKTMNETGEPVGVSRAVIDFTLNNGIDFHISENKRDFWFIKQ